MAADTEDINMVLVYIDRHMGISLNRIRMENDPVLFCDLSNLFDRLNSSDLVVSEHNGNQDGIRTDSFL